ncbi:hypothetical protein FQZ97_1021150 [compost metagenome]
MSIWISRWGLASTALAWVFTDWYCLRAAIAFMFALARVSGCDTQGIGSTSESFSAAFCANQEFSAGAGTSTSGPIASQACLMLSSSPSTSSIGRGELSRDTLASRRVM